MTTDKITAFEAVSEQINKELSAREVIPAEAADRIVRRLRAENPAALAEWLDAQAVQAVCAEIHRLMPSLAEWMAGASQSQSATKSASDQGVSR